MILGWRIASDAKVLCECCGYSLASLGDRGACPECGHSAQSSIARWQRLQRVPCRCDMGANGVALAIVLFIVSVPVWIGVASRSGWWWSLAGVTTLGVAYTVLTLSMLLLTAKPNVVDELSLTERSRKLTRLFTILQSTVAFMLTGLLISGAIRVGDFYVVLGVTVVLLTLLRFVSATKLLHEYAGVLGATRVWEFSENAHLWTIAFFAHFYSSCSHCHPWLSLCF